MRREDHLGPARDCPKRTPGAYNTYEAQVLHRRRPGSARDYREVASLFGRSLNHIGNDPTGLGIFYG